MWPPDRVELLLTTTLWSSEELHTGSIALSVSRESDLFMIPQSSVVGTGKRIVVAATAAKGRPKATMGTWAKTQRVQDLEKMYKDASACAML